MTQEEILQYNKRCAEFLGVDIHYSVEVYKDSKSPLRQYIHNRPKSEPLLFHSDWNWIMEVVEAVEKLGYATEISHDYCISNYGCDKCEIDTRNNAVRKIGEPPIVFSLTKTKQEAVVEAINQFLIWYEQNKTV